MDLCFCINFQNLSFRLVRCSIFLLFLVELELLICFFTIWVIFKFDKPFIKTLEGVNEKEHIITSTLFDSLSNIIIVIILQLGKSMESGLMVKVDNLIPPFRKNDVINELKCFTADMLLGLNYVVITFGYVYQNYEPNKVFCVGDLVTLLGFVN